MFCSNCGKTLLPGDGRCRHCGAPVGDSRFMGYTSAQMRILPGGTPSVGGRAYTRTTYNGIDAEATEADARTTYRPVYGGSSVPEEIREDVRAAVNPEEEISEEVQETVDQMVEEEFGDHQPVEEAAGDPDMRARPIESKGQSGISADVSEYIQKLESERERRDERERSRNERRNARSFAAQEPAAEDKAPEEDVFNTDFDDEEEDDFDERPRMNGKVLTIIKIAAIILVVAAIAVGVIMWVRHISDKTESAPIEGVSLELYNKGIETITAHADPAYVQTIIDKYQSDGILTMTTLLETDAGAFDPLLPAEPSINDALFVDALESIQENIGNAVTMDALAIAQPAADSEASSAARWQLINSSIDMLKSAATTTDLQAIIGGTKITIQTATPSPTPVPVTYTTLTRGDESEEVLRMQNRLWELGFLQDDRDGNFGGNTYTAVKAFQQSAGLDVTGIADSKTLTVLYSDDAPRTQFALPTTRPTGQAAATIAPTATPAASVEPAATETATAPAA